VPDAVNSKRREVIVPSAGRWSALTSVLLSQAVGLWSGPDLSFIEFFRVHIQDSLPARFWWG
jgi:hypothetical protein